MSKGIIFDIKRFAIHDGNGIRTTVFFKGCPLRCIWCHNPEGISSEKELMYHSERCIWCLDCKNICKWDAISEKRETILIDINKCNMCGDCVKVCSTTALELIGKQVSADDLIKEIEKDTIFYNESGGGVTFSGGEPLMQTGFLNEILCRCKEKNINTVLDTSGFAESKVLKKIMDKVDVFLYDLKIIDNNEHIKYTGVPNELILKNIEFLISTKKHVQVRFPLIPQITDKEKNLNDMIKFLLNLNIKKISILPYHSSGVEKLKRLNKKEIQKVIKSVPKKRVDEIKRKFEENEFKVKIGG